MRRRRTWPRLWRTSAIATAGGDPLPASHHGPSLAHRRRPLAETLAGIRRDAPDLTKRRAATLTVLRELLAPIPGNLRGLRDYALLLVCFEGALRRSELAGIRRAELERTDNGFQLTLPRSRGIADRRGDRPLPYDKTELCPVRALRQCSTPPASPRAQCSVACDCCLTCRTGALPQAGNASAPIFPCSYVIIIL